MLTSFSRSVRHATRDFVRNFWLSALTATIVALAFVSIHALIVVNTVMEQGIRMVTDRVDLAITFTSNVPRSGVEQYQNRILELSSVKEVQLVARDDRFRSLSERYAEDRAIRNALTAVGPNPLGDLLIVKARQLDDYDGLTQQINEIPGLKDSASVHMRSTQQVLERIQRIARGLTSGVRSVALLFGIIALLVVINTIRIVFYTHREEISIMRLVGASHMMIRGPFIINMLLINLLALMVSVIFTYAALRAVIPRVEGYFFGGTHVFPAGLLATGVPVVLLELAISSVVIVLVSGIALRRYLKS